MAKRENKNDALSWEKRSCDVKENDVILTVAPIKRSLRWAVVWAATFAAAFLTVETGCARGQKRFWRREKNVETVDVLAQTETALCVDGRVDRMEIAKNSKRILVELRDFDDCPEDAYSNFFASGGRRTSDGGEAGTSCVELWNVEFLEARREAFDAAREDVVGAATFDENGTRVFWTTREVERNGTFAASPGGASQAADAATTGFSGFATASARKGANFDGGVGGATENKVAQVAATIPAETTDWATGNAVYLWENSENDGVWRPAARTVLATRAFEKPDATTALTEGGANATRLKISEEAKSAEGVWLSPNARWIVGRGAVNAFEPETGENGELATAAQDASTASGGEWALTLRRDRRRVVRFPESVKMTFSESTSTETIEGRVVDVLAVSPAGDLVATLVEETAPSCGAPTKNSVGEVARGGEESEIGQTERFANVSATKEDDEFEDAEENCEEYGEREEYVDYEGAAESEDAGLPGRVDFIPRFKIVVWDLSVAETVDWEKAKKPLQALEVAQIAVSGPVSRRFCRFSPNGQILATRVDPRYITLWQAANGRLLVELGEHQNDVSDFAFSPNGMKVAAATGLGTRVVLWNIRKGAAHRALDETAPGVDSIDAVAFSPDGGSVYFANNLGEIKRWNARGERRSAPNAERR